MDTLIAITNPSDESAEAKFVHETTDVYTPQRILSDFGGKLEDGAQVVMVCEGRVWQYIATREADSIALRNNNGLSAKVREPGECFGDYVADEPEHYTHIIASGYHPLESGGSFTPAAELETFTVFGENDDGEDFVAVVSATEETVYDVAVKAGLIDDGFEADVDIHLILKGDQSDLERVTV